MPTYSQGESCGSETLNKVPQVSELVIGKADVEIMFRFTKNQSAESAWFVNLLTEPVKLFGLLKKIISVELISASCLLKGER